MSSPLVFKVLSRNRGDKEILIARTRHIGDAETIFNSEVDERTGGQLPGTVRVVNHITRQVVLKTEVKS